MFTKKASQPNPPYFTNLDHPSTSHKFMFTTPPRTNERYLQNKLKSYLFEVNFELL